VKSEAVNITSLKQNKPLTNTIKPIKQFLLFLTWVDG